MRRGKVVLFALLGLMFGLVSAFFCYYTLRLIYVNVAVPGVAAHRQSGMYIGAVVFPVAAIVCGWLCAWCIRASKGPAAKD